MKILFVYDSAIDKSGIQDISIGPHDSVVLFPLTSKACVNGAVLDFCKKSGCAFETVGAAGSINASAEKLRGKYLKFIAELPDRVSKKQRGLKEMFSVDSSMTLWWSSLISEKSTYKSDAFFRLAQLDALVGAARNTGVDKIVCGFESVKLGRALAEYCACNGVKIENVSCLSRCGIKGAFKKMGSELYVKHMVLLVYAAAKVFLRSVRMKSIFRNLARPRYGRSLALVTYYPNIDVKQAEKGVFGNRFWSNLQESLANDKINVTWISLYVPNNTMSFDDAMRYAVSFINGGNAIYFIEEFLSAREQCAAFWRIMVAGLRFMRMEGDIRKAHSMDGYNFYELFRDDWYSSFAGATGYLGMLYYGMFRAAASSAQWSGCLYPCEMHAWEKALVAAFRDVAPNLKLYAYQSGTISRMLLSYFNDPAEISDDRAYSMPKPDKVICDGNHPFRCLKESGWPEEKLLVGEAIRYYHLREHMDRAYPKKKVVLLALSISTEESRSILTFATAALKGMGGIEVWIKPHPFLDIDRVLSVSGLSGRDLPFGIKKDPIDLLLPDVRIMIVGESGVGVEALAFGCEVITISAPEWIDMSPLGHERSGVARHVRSPAELKSAVKEIMERAYEPQSVREESARILNDFFCLDRASDRPSRIMGLFR